MPDIPLSSIFNWGNVGQATPEAMGAGLPVMDPIANLVMGAAALPHVALKAAMVPGQVYNATQPITSDEMVKPAADLAMMTTLGAGAAPAEADALRMGIKAYHGSPHDFDRFDLSKIGTGEGAQAYGHGLYFAENEGVAKQYEKALSAAKDIPSDVLAQYYTPGQIVPGYSGLDLVKKYDPTTRAVTVRSVDKEGNPTQDLLGLRDRVHTTQPTVAEVNRAFKERGLPEYKPGRMYEVNINADPEHFLDWDKPLRDQTHLLDKVKSALPPDPTFDAWKNNGVLENAPVASIYKGAAGMTNADVAAGRPANFSEALRSAGIPGIKYLDQGSRASGEGSRNYVVFDDKLIDILRKYGLVGGAPLGGAIGAGLLARPETIDQHT